MVSVLGNFYLDGTYKDYDDRSVKWISIGHVANNHRLLWLVSVAPKGLFLFEGLEEEESYDLNYDNKIRIIGVDII